MQYLRSGNLLLPCSTRSNSLKEQEKLGSKAGLNLITECVPNHPYYLMANCGHFYRVRPLVSATYARLTLIGSSTLKGEGERHTLSTEI